MGGKTGKNENLVVRVQLNRSPIGYPPNQRATLTALGLHKLGDIREVPDNRAVRGMLYTVRHLVGIHED